ncbi:copper resistance CopC family protein [Phycicoccus sp. Soil803]|uniref:copper resistance CopC family protein n=1 Tax=Phycicoccus sp. Soil803 TaxID=1736415 RepID=UPI001F46E119|nr:copper resistance CopC family protein [Phycicoccus sp. Soil803]
MDSEGKTKVIRIGVWVAIIGLLLGVLSSLVMATSADAHAVLRSITPKDGATLTAVPTKVVLTFNEPIGTSFATVSVAGPDGSVSEGKAVVDGSTVTQALADDLPNGRYTVSFHVVSEDGHPVSDRTTFSVAAVATATPLPAPSSTSTTSAPPTSEPTTSTPSTLPADDEGDGRALRLGLAVGVAALALAGGTALVAASRRRSGD